MLPAKTLVKGFCTLFFAPTGEQFCKMDDLRKEFGARLARAIRAAGKSINRIAAETQTDRAQLKRILNGQTLPGAEKLRALAEATGVSADALLGLPADAETESGREPGAQPPTDEETAILEAVRQIEDRDPELLRAMLLLGEIAIRQEPCARVLKGLAEACQPGGPRRTDERARTARPLRLRRKAGKR